MDRVFEVLRSRLLALVGVGGFLSIGAMGGVPLLLPSTPDAGALEPITAVSAEDTRIEVLASGRTFGEILSGTPLSGSEQHAVLLAFRERANPTRLRTGTEVSLRYARGDVRLRGVDVAVSSDELVRLERHPYGWSSEVVETPVWADTIAVAGTIDTDLWSAVVFNPALAHMPNGDRAQVIHYLDRVFQWQLDFSRQIQQGDSYRLVFERQVRPDGSMRSGQILAAELVNSGSPLHAVYFDLHGDGVGGYYDLEGESLRRAFMRAPLEYRRISSRFSRNRYHPILNRTRAHTGVDYAAATGTPVMATSDGVVTHRGVNGGYGNMVEIRHANGYVTRYAHLNGFADVRSGGRVSQGQVVGYVGMTGLATGPHLHYELHQNGTPVDPLNIDMPSGDPIPSEARERWESELRTRHAMLESLPGGPVLTMAQIDREDADQLDRGTR